jgi:YD repeat-containing protein
MPNCQRGGTQPMKQFLSFLALLLIGFVSSSVHAQLFNQYPPLSKEELKKSKIKSISEQNFSTCDVSDYKHLTSASASYDARGNMTYSYRYGQWTGEPQMANYKYDEQDNVIERTTDYHTTRYEHHYALNDKGKVLQDTYPGGKHTLKYDESGTVVESAYFTQDGRLDGKTTYSFDDKGKLIETLIYDSSGKVSSRTVATYDTAGHRTREEKYDAGGPLSASTSTTYDAAGHRTKEEKYVSSGAFPGTTIDTYNEAGQIAIEEHYGPNGALTYWTTYKHDPKGLVIESDNFHPKGECSGVTKGSYEFYP